MQIVPFCKAAKGPSLQIVQQVCRPDGPPLSLGWQLCRHLQSKEVLALQLLRTFPLYLHDNRFCHRWYWRFIEAVVH